MSASGLPGKRVDAMRAGIRMRADIVGWIDLKRSAGKCQKVSQEPPLYVLQQDCKRPSFRRDLTGAVRGRDSERGRRKWCLFRPAAEGALGVWTLLKSTNCSVRFWA